MLNKARYSHDKRFTDAFLIVAPGIIIRDRLPSDPNSYCRDLGDVPTEHRGELASARGVIKNFHASKTREKGLSERPVRPCEADSNNGVATKNADEV